MRSQFQVPEGASPIEDASGLILKIWTYDDLCAAEAENILQAVNIHLKRRKEPSRMWFTEKYIRKVHYDMFESVWKWAGVYRESSYTIGILPSQIRDEIAKLCGDVRYWTTQKANPMSVLESAVRIHHRLAWIHPFQNGNGRHARLMADIYLHAHGFSLPIWPSSDISKEGRTRKQYLQAIRRADNGDFRLLLEYTARYLPN